MKGAAPRAGSDTGAPAPGRGATRARRLGELGLLARGLTARGVPFTRIVEEALASQAIPGRRAISFVVGDVRVHVTNAVRVYLSPEGRADARPRNANGAASRIFRDKALASAILHAAGLPTPAGYKIAAGERTNRRHVYQGLTHVAPHGLVVKPNRGRHGRHVALRVQALDAFADAHAEAAADGDAVLVETMVPGAIHRLYVVDGHTIATRTGHSATGHSNRHQGARIIDTTHTLHPSYKTLAEHAIAQFPGTFIAGLDLAVTDPTIPANPGPNPNCHIIEINTSPGFIGHHYPDEGEAIDVAGAIIDALLARFAPTLEARAPLQGRATR